MASLMFSSATVRFELVTPRYQCRMTSATQVHYWLIQRVINSTVLSVNYDTPTLYIYVLNFGNESWIPNIAAHDFNIHNRSFPGSLWKWQPVDGCRWHYHKHWKSDVLNTDLYGNATLVLTLYTNEASLNCNVLYLLHINKIFFAL